MLLAPLALGPVGYATFFSAGLFHDPGSGLFQYVKMFDAVQFCLAVFGWTVMIELLRSHKLALRCCFVGVLVLFYLAKRVMTDGVVDGKLSEPCFRRAIVWLGGSRCAGTLVAQVLLVPAAALIAYIADRL